MILAENESFNTINKVLELTNKSFDPILTVPCHQLTVTHIRQTFYALEIIHSCVFCINS